MEHWQMDPRGLPREIEEIESEWERRGKVEYERIRGRRVRHNEGKKLGEC